MDLLKLFDVNHLNGVLMSLRWICQTFTTVIVLLCVWQYIGSFFHTEYRSKRWECWSIQKEKKIEEQMLGWHPLFNFQSKCTRLVNKMEKYETIAYKKNTNSHRHFTGKQYTGYLHGGHLQINSYKTWWNIVSEARQPNRLHRMPIEWFIYVYI